VERAMGIEPTS